LRTVPTDLSYGQGAPLEAEARLLGTVGGKRILVLGCTEPSVPVALAEQEAKVVTVEPDLDRLDAARARTESADVRVELHNVDFADLAFVRAETIDAAVAVRSLTDVDDLDRVFRQVHRVLRSQCPLVLSLPHPASTLVDGRSWFDRSVSDVFTSLTRTSFGVDVLLEPLPAPGARFPTMLVVRGRKLGK
jgi:ubiquinone/menaquinone biosynthesis C-methylase UbiE